MLHQTIKQYGKDNEQPKVQHAQPSGEAPKIDIGPERADRAKQFTKAPVRLKPVSRLKRDMEGYKKDLEQAQRLKARGHSQGDERISQVKKAYRGVRAKSALGSAAKGALGVAKFGGRVLGSMLSGMDE